MRLKTFAKGVHPTESKELSEAQPIERLPLPTEVFIPLQQHIGAPCIPTVTKGQLVKTGEVIGTSGGFVSSTIHATITGKVKAIEKFVHPLGINATMINIVAEGPEELQLLAGYSPQWEDLSREALLDLILSAGIVGLGGAAFPTQVKLNPPKHKTIDTFIVNGCECEPYLTADHRMLLEQSEELLVGIRIVMKVLNVSRAIIGIEANKPDAIQKLQSMAGSYPGIEVIPLRVKYPQGAEKMLIDAIIKRRVPTGGLPMDVGVVVQNVGTVIAIAQAVLSGKPLIERVVTVTGDGIVNPKNLLVRIGTPFQRLIDYCGGITPDTVKIIMGGPMMGVAQSSLQVPVVKATSGIVCLTKKSTFEYPTYPCIQCGNCVSVCPMNLLPTRIARFAEVGNLTTAEELGALNCIECGSCAYVCPAHIPLVHQIRLGKLRINEQKRQAKTS